MSKILKNLFIGFISFSLISSIIVLGILWNFSNNIPDYKFLKNYKPPVSSKVYSGNGDLVADFSKREENFCSLMVQFLKMLLMLSYLLKIKNFFFSSRG